MQKNKYNFSQERLNYFNCVLTITVAELLQRRNLFHYFVWLRVLSNYDQLLAVLRGQTGDLVLNILNLELSVFRQFSVQVMPGNPWNDFITLNAHGLMYLGR